MHLSELFECAKQVFEKTQADQIYITVHIFEDYNRFLVQFCLSIKSYNFSKEDN